MAMVLETGVALRERHAFFDGFDDGLAPWGVTFSAGLEEGLVVVALSEGVHFLICFDLFVFFS